MGGIGAALSGAASAIGTGAKAVGSDIAGGAKSLYGDEKNMLQYGNPAGETGDPSMIQALLFGAGQNQGGETPADRNRRLLAMQQGS